MAILLAALAPSLSHAVAAAGKAASGWTEICSIGGSRFVRAGDGPASSGPGEKSLHVEHCPFCTDHAGAPGPLSAPALTLPVIDGIALLPALYHRAAHPPPVWSGAQSRAPPSHC